MKKALLSVILATAMLLGTVTVFAADTGFIDVKESRWSCANIMWAVENGYMNGVGDGKFNPAGATTRAMVVTVLYRLAGSPATAYAEYFSDIPKGKGFTDAVVWAAQNNVVNATTPTTFAPNNNITREQLAAIFYRYAEFDNVKTENVRADLSKYADVKKVSSYAKDAMAWANKIGLVNGVTETTLNPKGNATREQFAAILNRYATYEDFDYRLVYNRPAEKSHYTEKEYPLVTDADVYVSPNGKDTNDGKSTKTPVKSFEKAVSLVREIKKTKISGEIKVAFMAGDYGKLNVTLTAEDAGTAACPIKYCAYGDGEVLFNNGTTIKKDAFKPLDESDKALFDEKAVDGIRKVSLDGIFEGGLPDGATLYSGSTACWEARYPNKSGGIDSYYKSSIDTVGEGEYFTPKLTIKPPMTRVFAKCRDLTGAKVVGYVIRGYRIDTFYVTDYDKTTNVLSFDPDRVHEEFATIGIRAPENGDDKIYLADVPELLDTDGEYWCDKKTNTLYVYAPQSDFDVATDGGFIKLQVTDYVTISGLTFKNCYNDDCILIDSSCHTTVENCKVSCVVGTSSVIQFINDSEGLTVRDCDFSRFRNFGIRLKPSKKNRASLKSHEVVIDNNSFTDCGLGATFENQAIMDYAIGTVVSHNLFENSESGAMKLSGFRCTVEYNVFRNMLTCTQDYGCLYIYNGIAYPENVIRYNIFDTIPSNGQNYAIYLDDTTFNQYVYGNIFYDCESCGVMIHNARDEHVHDNVLIESPININGTIWVDSYTGEIDRTLIKPDNSGGRFWRNVYNFVWGVNSPHEGEEGYEIWREAFPMLYSYVIDYDDVTYRENIFCPYNEIYDNCLIGEDAQFDPPAFSLLVGDIRDNEFLTDEENPYFVDPTHGDYTIRDGADFFKIPYELIGRY